MENLHIKINEPDGVKLRVSPPSRPKAEIINIGSDIMKLYAISNITTGPALGEVVTADLVGGAFFLGGWYKW
jgi:hypothetical protein